MSEIDVAFDRARFAAWQAKARTALVKRSTVPSDVLAEHTVLDVAEHLPAEAIARVAIWLHPQAFTSTARQRLWRAIVDVRASGRECNLIEAAGEDDSARLAAIEIVTLSMYPTCFNFEPAARIVAGWHAYREAASQTTAALDVSGCSVAEAIDRLRAVSVSLPALSVEAAAQAWATGADLARDVLASQTGQEDEAPPLPTSLDELDRVLGGGLRRDRPTLIGAATGVGKTALALQIALSAAQRDVPVYYVHAESTRRVWAQRALAHLGRIPLGSILDRTAPPSDLMGTLALLSDLPVIVDDGRIADKRANLDVHSVIERILTAHRTRPLGLVVVDYLTKLTIRERFERPDLRVAALSNALAGLAKRLDAPVLILAQLNDLRPGEPPNLQNIAESRKPVHDAGAVLLLWTADTLAPHNMEILVAKSALSSHGRGVPLHFDGPTQRFSPRVGSTAPRPRKHEWNGNHDR